MRPSGRVIAPIMRKNGLGVWQLEPGHYIIATVRRRRGLRALEVTAQCLEGWRSQEDPKRVHILHSQVR